MSTNSNTYPLHLLSRETVNYKLLKLIKVFSSLSSIKKKLKQDSSVVLTKKEIIVILKTNIPKTFFGSENNKILFFRLVNKLLNQRKKEFVHVSLLFKGFDNCSEWSTNLKNLTNFQEIQKNINLFLLEKCVKPLIKKHFVYVLHLKSYRIDLIPKRRWQSFRDRIIHHMILKKHIIVKKRYSQYSARGALQILPKGNCESSSYRPVIRYFKNTETTESLNNIIKLKNKLKAYVKNENIHLSTLHTSWSNFVEKERGNIIYGIKADIEDCFGSIDINILARIIQQLPSNFSEFEKFFLLNRINYQFVKINDYKQKCVVRWCHGILQGDRLSSVLCDLYYLILVDQKLMKGMVGNNFFHRTVDDYIFCSAIKQNVQKFLLDLSHDHVLNQAKIYSNVEVYKKQVELPYCGYVFNLITKEVQIMYDFKGTFLKDKFKLWYDYINDNPEKYLRNIMKFSSANFYFSKIVFDTHFNSEETILKNYFHSMLYLGMKFNCAFMELKQYHPEYISSHCDKMRDIILEIIKHYSNKIFSLIKRWQGPLFNNQINMKTLYAISLRAFILIFRKKQQVYGNIIKSLKGTIPMKMNFLGGFNVTYILEIPSFMRMR